ncbi:ATP-binding protein [Nocardioides sp.]|uniref:ATP-binding protein n=1 Tax=Nocardioides sp. TaxID=35761 RepID=UPI003561B610
MAATNGQLRAIVIDDTADLRDLLKIALTRKGFVVAGEAADGRAGIDLVRKVDCDLIMLDLAMPVMDGLEALPWIRRIRPHAWIVVLSGFGAQVMSTRALRSGADGYIQKGASTGQILTYLEQLTSGHEPPRSIGLADIVHHEDSEAEMRAHAAAVHAAPFGVVELDGAEQPRVRGANLAAQRLLRSQLTPGTPLASVSIDLAEALDNQRFVNDPSFQLRLGDTDLSVSLRRSADTTHLYLVPGGDDPGLLRRAIASTAHELRGPVSVIIGVAETVALTANDPHSEQRLRLLESVARQARMLDNLTADLLTAAQITGSTLRVTIEEIDPLEVITTLVANRHDAHVVCADSFTVHADSLRLEQMVENLLTNAEKYGRPPYQVTIDGDADQVRIAVRDHGDGVPEDFRERLFDEFTRAPRIRAPGTGMGLFIVRALAEAQHGTVDYAPVESGGSVFTITLPRA